MDTVKLKTREIEQTKLVGLLQSASGTELVQALSHHPAMLNLVLQSRTEEGEK